MVAGFPDKLTDTDGAIIDLKELVSKKRVIVITIKTPECPVCQHQLIRIKEKLNVLVACNVTFLVLSPGSVDKIEKAKELVAQQHVGGVIFSKGGPKRQVKVQNELQELSKIPLLT